MLLPRDQARRDDGREGVGYLRLATTYGTPGQLVWDAVLFGPEPSWGDRPPEPLGHQSPVVEYMATLKSLLRPYLEWVGPAQAPAGPS